MPHFFSWVSSSGFIAQMTLDKYYAPVGMQGVFLILACSTILFLVEDFMDKNWSRALRDNPLQHSNPGLWVPLTCQGCQQWAWKSEITPVKGGMLHCLKSSPALKLTQRRILAFALMSMCSLLWAMVCIAWKFRPKVMGFYHKGKRGRPNRPHQRFYQGCIQP